MAVAVILAIAGRWSWPAPPGGASRSMQKQGVELWAGVSLGGRGSGALDRAGRAAHLADVLAGAAILQGKKGPAAAVSSTRCDRGRSHARGGRAAIVQRKFHHCQVVLCTRAQKGLSSQADDT